MWVVVPGLVLLAVGAELLVRGASRLAVALGLSPLVVGLTVVAFGTSAPELAASLGAASAGHGEIAIGNVIGSNIFNVLVVLGVAALFAPLVVHPQVVRRDVPVMVGASLLFVGMALDGRIGRGDGAVLTALALLYVGWTVVQSRRESAEIRREYAQELAAPDRPGPLQIGLDVVWVLAGLGLLVLGARWLISGAVSIAQALGTSDAVIGVTVVAAGTSVPELATSVFANLRGQRDIAVGNAIGSSVFNIVAILGLTALVAPTGLTVPPATLGFDLPVMVAVALACTPLFVRGGRIERWQGGLFLVAYVAYLTDLGLAELRHPASATFRAAVGVFGLALVAAMVGATAWRRRRGRGA